ncbi:GNAT family N-acetyltransferase [Polynucleobacter sp. es-EL-1]|uniref:GNAT family N-acetyltransferase n=1 Tax=Polynucleobacter sp. es-EL-1 TaxID=1855652 RepID=UPI001BFE725F|nr:GNAT family N-acetyltransferase [Polynucleobacter sp. es-EL-1]QWE10859.1 GNAT family N-acetyltransferase [Polynucleobacter sp. es-EL-1]
MTLLTPVPWDKKALERDCYEVSNLELHRLEEFRNTPGHFTLRIDPLTPATQIQKFGFRYVDTLIVPRCHQEDFLAYPNSEVSIAKSINLSDVSAIASNAFVHGRYHRDNSIPHHLAENRYQNWLTDLYVADKVLGIEYQGRLAAFIAIEDSKLILHAVHSELRGQGLAKYLWTPVCEELFAKGCPTIESSISAANLAVVNLYARLGFTLKSAQDIYHFHNEVGGQR